MVLLVAVPIMIQNGITNFVSLLDNIMVGQIGTEQMSGVAIVNQLLLSIICAFSGDWQEQGFLRLSISEAKMMRVCAIHSGTKSGWRSF